MNTLITPLDDDPETREILANARAAVLSGEISEDRFNDIYNSCYRAMLERLAERRAELGYLEVMR